MDMQWSASCEPGSKLQITEADRSCVVLLLLKGHPPATAQRLQGRKANKRGVKNSKLHLLEFESITSLKKRRGES
jgi:hypothetical protein